MSTPPLSLSDRATAAVREQTRRDILAKTGLVAGAVGLGILAKAPPAMATDGTGLDFEDLQFEGYNNVKDPKWNESSPGLGDGGAKGDGVTDDTLAIDACIQASAASVGAATVYFPPGTYIITRDNLGVPGLYLLDGTHLLGSGPLSVLKRGGNNSGGALLRRTDPTDPTHPFEKGKNIRIENLVLDGNRGQSNEASFLINLRGSRIFIRGVEGRNGGPDGFSFHCHLKDSAIQDCFVHDGASDGMNLDGDNLLVQGNVIRDCDDDHIVVNARRGRHISIVGNVSDKTNISSGGAIVIRGGWAQDPAGATITTGVTISGNVCHGGPQAGIVITSQTGPVHDVLVSNNVLVNPGFNHHYGVPNGSGIALFVPPGQQPNDIQNVRISENLVINPYMHGIMIKPPDLAQPDPSDPGSITDVTISRNTIWMGAKTEGTIRFGIACNLPQRPVRNLAVIGNEIRDATGPGIDIERDTTETAAVVERCCVEGNRILNSGTTGTPQPAIRIDNVLGVVVTGNRATDTQSGASKTQDHGLRATELTGPVLVTRNVFTDNRNDHTVDLPPPSGPGPSLLGIRDNPGFSPWSGDVSLTSWSAGPPYVTEVSVSFGIAFPSSAPPPQVICTVKPGMGTSLDAYAVAKDVTRTGFTLRVISSSPPGANPHKASWMAEPST